MAITFHPKAGLVLLCDMRGSIAPEISKVRPVVVITPWYLKRTDLATIVPLSTKRPYPREPHHVLLTTQPYPSSARKVWAKCDLAMSVSYQRLDRIPLRSGHFITGFVSDADLERIYFAVAHGFGLDSRGRRR